MTAAELMQYGRRRYPGLDRSIWLRLLAAEIGIGWRQFYRYLSDDAVIPEPTARYLVLLEKQPQR